MKKIILSSLFVAALSFAFTGCLKDKGFENFEYGINDPDTQPPGVGFSFGSRAKNDYGLDVTAQPQTVNGLVHVNMLTGVRPASDVNVSISNNTTALVAAYNAANGTNIQVMPTALYTVSSTLVIPAGSPFAEIPLVVSNTTSLNPNLQYAVGLTISAVDGGYKIADNMKNLFIVFSVKNKYDGKYTMKGQFYHPSLQPDFGPHTFSVELHTAGPDDVRLYWPLVAGYEVPITSGGGAACCFASQTLGVHVDPATNVAVCSNVHPTGTIVYQQGAVPSRWEDGPKRFILSWGYSLGPGGVVVPGTSRGWIDTLTRTGPR